MLHLLYSRFWHKVLFDRGLVSTAEPFQKLVNQGMILGEIEYTGYRGPSRSMGLERESSSPTNTQDRGGRGRCSQARPAGQARARTRSTRRARASCWPSDPTVRVDARAHKMSKSRGNVINPDTVVDEYGADSLRLYEMFMGPLEAVKPWSMKGVEGVYRFLARAWRMVVDAEADEVRLDPSVQDVEPISPSRRRSSPGRSPR